MLITHLTKSKYAEEETRKDIDFLWNGKTDTSSFEGFVFPQRKCHKRNPAYKENM